VLEPFEWEAPKTAAFILMLKNLHLEGKKVLMVLPQNNDTIYLSSRNLQRVKVTTFDELNTYDILNAGNLILVDGVQELLQNQLGNA